MKKSKEKFHYKQSNICNADGKKKEYDYFNIHEINWIYERK